MDGVKAVEYFNKSFNVGHMDVKKYYFVLIWPLIKDDVPNGSLYVLNDRIGIVCKVFKVHKVESS